MRQIAQIFSAELARIKKDIPEIEEYDFVYTPALAAAFSKNIYDISESVSTQLSKYTFFFNSPNFRSKILSDSRLVSDSRVLQNKIKKYESYVGATNFPIFVEVVFRTIELSQFPILTPGDFEQIKKLEINQTYEKFIKLSDQKSFLPIQFIKTAPKTIRVIEG